MSSVPTPAEPLPAPHVHSDYDYFRAQEDAKRYMNLFKSCLNDNNRFYRVKCNRASVTISRISNGVSETKLIAEYNACVAKSLYIALRLHDNDAEQLLKYLTENMSAMDLFRAGDYKKVVTPL